MYLKNLNLQNVKNTKFLLRKVKKIKSKNIK